MDCHARTRVSQSILAKGIAKVPDVFKDAKGREWQLSLSYGDAKRVKKLLGLNLFTLVDKSPTEAKEEVERGEMGWESMPVFMQLQLDPILLGDVIYAIVKPQLDAKSISDDEFSDSIGPKEFKAIKDIFWRLYHDFFLEAGETAKAKMIKGSLKLTQGMEDQADRLDKDIEKAIAAIGE